MNFEFQEKLDLENEGYLVAEEIPHTGLSPKSPRSNPDHET
jgi:hypothetical protein